MKTSYKFLTYLALTITLASCENLIDVPNPSNELITETVFTNELTAKASISGLYAKMIGNGGLASGYVYSATFLSALSSDELIIPTNSVDLLQFNQNSLLSTNKILPNLWNEGFAYIYYANAIIEGVNKSNTLSSNTKQQLTGEALFVRAFTEFYLTNLFGDVPYPTTTDYKTNQSLTRLPVQTIYNNIVNDLILAESLLADNYSFANDERIRPNKYAATSLLARVYLFKEDWSSAIQSASKVISASDLYSLSKIDEAFLKNNNEAIWQLKPNTTYTPEGNILFNPSGSFLVSISPEFIASFEINDLRRSMWIYDESTNSNTRYVPAKYKISDSSEPQNEYYTVIRLAEMYLIRAEAFAHVSDNAGSEADLNVVRARAGLSELHDLTDQDLANAIEKEWKLEYFVEWATRWLYLKRTGKVDNILSTLKPAWNESDKLYPIPNEEILINNNIKQNDGY